jgi:hypothetical protein
MQAWLSLLFGDAAFAEYLSMSGAAMAEVATLSKNLRRDAEKV